MLLLIPQIYTKNKMRILSVLTLLATLLAVPALAANDTPVFPKGQVVIQTSGGVIHEFASEIANTPRLRSHGYMFRKYIPPMTGMLFIWADEDHRSFWMRNTPLPLDLVFVRQDGSIAHIIRNAAPMNDDALPSKEPAQYVFEVYAGTTERLGIGVGDRLSFSLE